MKTNCLKKESHPSEYLTHVHVDLNKSNKAQEHCSYCMYPAHPHSPTQLQCVIFQCADTARSHSHTHTHTSLLSVLPVLQIQGICELSKSLTPVLPAVISHIENQLQHYRCIKRHLESLVFLRNSEITQPMHPKPE